MKHNFETDAVDIDYLINSGLLFTINQHILHMFGIGFVVKADREGNKELAFKDMRTEPEKMILDTKTFNAGQEKYKVFTKEFGFKQIERRQNKLGWGCQFCPPNEGATNDAVNTK